jgi:hypothetical protein
MAAPTNVGVTSVTNSEVQSLEISAKCEVKFLVTREGKYGKGAVFDPRMEFSIRGKGSNSNPYPLASSPSIAGLSGKIIVNSSKISTTNDDWPEWEASGEAYPAAR